MLRSVICPNLDLPIASNSKPTTGSIPFRSEYILIDVLRNFCFISNEVPFTSSPLSGPFSFVSSVYKSRELLCHQRLFIQPSLLAASLNSSLPRRVIRVFNPSTCSCCTGNLNEHSMTALFLNPVFYYPCGSFFNTSIISL